jgi:hypothetical protein
MYAPLQDYFSALHTERAYADTGLLAIINPDESGEDNSPRFDDALGLPPHHSVDAHLDARVDLMATYAARGFSAFPGMQDSFAILDVGFNMIYLDGLEAMVDIATLCQDPVHATMMQQRKECAISSAWQYFVDDRGNWNSYDIVRQQQLHVRTWNDCLPLFAGILDRSAAATLIQQFFQSDDAVAPYGIRTTAACEASYDEETGFWRGPIWAAPHWFAARGLARYGYHQAAAQLGEQLLTLTKRSGWREQYHPATGAGQGATGFTWNGLALDIIEPISTRLGAAFPTVE